MWLCLCSTEVPRFLAAFDDAKCMAPVAELLQKEWGKLHEMYLHHLQEPIADDIPEGSGKKKKVTCLDAGVCLCGESGPNIYRIHAGILNVFLKLMNTAELKVKLNNGDLVLRIECERPIPKLEGDEGDEGGGGVFIEDKFLRVSLQYWIPKRPTFRVLTWPGRFVGVLGRLHLRATAMYNTLYEFAARLDAEQLEVLRRRFLLVHSSRRPLRQVDPTMLGVEGIAGLGELELHSKLAKREHRGRVGYADRWAAAGRHRQPGRWRGLFRRQGRGRGP